jgi:hypothetical protein
MINLYHFLKGLNQILLAARLERAGCRLGLLLLSLNLSLVSTIANADQHRTEWPESHDCVNEIPQLIAQAVAPVRVLEFCPDFMDGVKFGFFEYTWGPDALGPRLLGSPSGLFGFRQPGFSHNVPNSLNLVLVPREGSVHLWDVHFQTWDGEISEMDGDTEWIIWSEYQVPRPGSRLQLPADDTVARLISCRQPHGCGSRYVVPVCDDYVFPWFSERDMQVMPRLAAPRILISIKDYDRGKEVIANFGEVNNLVKLAMQVTLRMSCR